jgi:hypothetical protein
MFLVAMGSHADDIVGDYFETEDWGALEDAETEPELNAPAPAPHESRSPSAG